MATDRNQKWKVWALAKESNQERYDRSKWQPFMVTFFGRGRYSLSVHRDTGLVAKGMEWARLCKKHPERAIEIEEMFRTHRFMMLNNMAQFEKRRETRA